MKHYRNELLYHKISLSMKVSTTVLNSKQQVDLYALGLMIGSLQSTNYRYEIWHSQTAKNTEKIKIKRKGTPFPPSQVP